MNECPNGLFDVCCNNYENCSLSAPKLRREWQGLTDEEIEVATGCDTNKPLWIAILGVARAIEAKLQEKNT